MLHPLFTTPVLRETTPLSPSDLSAVREYLLSLMAASPGETRSNRGGWHFQGNLFAPEFRQFPALRAAVTNALFSYIGDVFGYRGEIQMTLSGWSVINRPGDFNVPHNHASNLLSGVLYVAVPDGMRGGAIVFQDPRLSLNGHTSAGMRAMQLRPPWELPNHSVVPTAGEILIFPSWLSHYVEPFQCDDPGAQRIVISFNASV